jgi:hypothetical protein
MEFGRSWSMAGKPGEAGESYAEAEALCWATDPAGLVPGELAWPTARFAGAKARLTNKEGRFAEANLSAKCPLLEKGDQYPCES